MEKKSFTQVFLLDADEISAMVTKKVIEYTVPNTTFKHLTDPEQLVREVLVWQETISDERIIILLDTASGCEEFLVLFQKLAAPRQEQCKICLISTASQKEFDSYIKSGTHAERYQNTFISKPLRKTDIEIIFA